jgi:hypothetical protein
MRLPPEVASLDVPTLLREQPSGRKVVPLAGDWDDEPQAVVELKGGMAEIELPSVCHSTRTFGIDQGGIVTLGVFDGC